MWLSNSITKKSNFLYIWFKLFLVNYSSIDSPFYTTFQLLFIILNCRLFLVNKVIYSKYRFAKLLSSSLFVYFVNFRWFYWNLKRSILKNVLFCPSCVLQKLPEFNFKIFQIMSNNFTFILFIVLACLVPFIHSFCETPDNGLCDKNIILGNKLSGK